MGAARSISALWFSARPCGGGELVGFASFLGRGEVGPGFVGALGAVGWGNRAKRGGWRQKPAYSLLVPPGSRLPAKAPPPQSALASHQHGGAPVRPPRPPARNHRRDAPPARSGFATALQAFGT